MRTEHDGVPNGEAPVPVDGIQDDPNYVPPEPDLDLNEVPKEHLELDTYTDEDLKGEEPD